MQPNSAYSLVPIVKGTDYSPTSATINKDGYQVNAGLTAPIYALLCVKSTGAGSVQIQALGDTAPITFTADVFKVGVIYPIYIKKLVDDAGGSVGFVGFKYSAHPQSL